MDEEMKDLLAEEIKEEIRNLSDLNPGSEEKSKAIDDVAKLYKLRIEETKAEWDFQAKYESMERDDEMKKNQLVQEVRNRYFRVGIDVAGVVLPLIFYAVWMQRGFKFEETGAYTSTTFRGLFNRFRPTK